MSNLSIPSRIQWKIPSNQCNSDTDSTISDLEALSPSILEDDYLSQKKKEKDTVKKVNNTGFNEETKTVSGHFQKMCNIKGISSPSVFENNTCLTEIVGKSWKENVGSVRSNEENSNKENIFTKCEDKTTGFETNSELTEIVGRNWSENINKNLQLERIPTKVGELSLVDSKQNNSQSTLENYEVSFAQDLQQKWKIGTEKTVSNGGFVVGKLTEKVIENTGELMFESIEDDQIESYNQNKVNTSSLGQCDVILKEMNECLNDQHKIVTSNEKVELIVNNTVNLQKSCATALDGNEMNIDSHMLNTSTLSSNNTQKNPSQNSSTPTYLEGSTSNIEKIGAEKMYGNVFYDIFRSIKNNETKQNDPILGGSSDLRKHRKPKVFPESREPKPKRNCCLKNKNVNIKGITQIKNKDAESVSPKKKTKAVRKRKACSDFSECQMPRVEKSKTTLEKEKLKKVKNAEVLVTIGARLDEIKTCITKWLNGDKQVTLSRIDAINMLDNVRNILADLTTMYRGTGRKPAPAKKLFDAANILELQIGKAISDADLLYKTEELKRLQMLKCTKEGETDSDESSTSSSESTTSSACKDEVEKCDQDAVRKLDKNDIIQSLTELSFDKIPLDGYNLQVNNSNLKSILKNTYDHCVEKKQLNFSDNVEYFEISQRLAKNVGETLSKELDENVATHNENEKYPVTNDEDYEMLDEKDGFMRSAIQGRETQNSPKVASQSSHSDDRLQNINMQNDMPQSVNLGVSQVEKQDSFLGNKLENKTYILKPESGNLEISNVNRTSLSVVKENSLCQSVGNQVTMDSGVVNVKQDILPVEYGYKLQANVLNSVKLKSLISDHYNSNQHGSSVPKQNLQTNTSYSINQQFTSSGPSGQNSFLSPKQNLQTNTSYSMNQQFTSSGLSTQNSFLSPKQNYYSNKKIKTSLLPSRPKYILEMTNSSQKISSQENYCSNNILDTTALCSSRTDSTISGLDQNSSLVLKQNYFPNKNVENIASYSANPESVSSGIADSIQNSSSFMKQNYIPIRNVENIASFSANPQSVSSGLSDPNQNSPSVLKKNYFPIKNVENIASSAKPESVSSGIADSIQNSSSFMKQNYIPIRNVENIASFSANPQSVSSGVSDPNQNSPSVLKQNYFPIKNVENIASSAKPESMSSVISDSIQNSSSLRKQNYIPIRNVENIASFSTNPESVSSGVSDPNQNSPSVLKQNYIPIRNVENIASFSANPQSVSSGLSDPNQNSPSVLKKNYFPIKNVENIASSAKPESVSSGIADSIQNSSSFMKQNYIPIRNVENIASFSANPQSVSSGVSDPNQNSPSVLKQNYFPIKNVENIASSAKPESMSSVISDSIQNSSSLRKQNYIPIRNVENIASFSTNPESVSSGVSDPNQNSPSVLKQNYFPIKNFENIASSAKPDSMSSVISDSNQNSSSLRKQNYIPIRNVENIASFSTNPESVSSGVSDPNQNSPSVLKQNYFPIKNFENIASSAKPESMSSVISDSNQNSSSVLKENYFLNNTLEYAKSFSSKSESMTSIMEMKTKSSNFPAPSSFSNFTFTETEESWRHISIMGVKKLRIKSESEYHKDVDDDGDWFSGWI